MHKMIKINNHSVIKSCWIITLVSVTTLITIIFKTLKKRQPTENDQNYRNNKLLPIPLIIITGCDTGLGYSIVMKYLNDDHYNKRQNYRKVFNFSLFSHKQIVIPNKVAIVAFCLNPSGPGAKRLHKLSHENINVKLFIKQLDLTDTKSIKEAVHFVNDLLEHKINENNTNDTFKLHALINNAARMIMAEYEWQTLQMIQQQFDVNVLGPMMLTAQLLPTFRKNKSRVINVISHCAYLPLPGISIYAATKAAVRAWSVGSRVELSNYGVQMITFLPGSFYRHSSIMNGQQRTIDYNKMYENMSTEQLTYYGAYFDAYQNYLSSIDAYIYDLEEVIPRTNKIYCIMDNALWASQPKAEYSVPEPWRYKVYFYLAWVLSASGLHYFRDKVVSQFVNTPHFQNYVTNQDKHTEL